MDGISNKRKEAGSPVLLPEIVADSGPGQLFDEHQLAFRQQRSVRTLRNERWRGGGVPFVKLGRSVRYRWEDILAFEKARLRRSTSDCATDPHSAGIEK